MLEAQLNYSLEAHKCGIGVLARGALVTIESSPNRQRVQASSKQSHGGGAAGSRAIEHCPRNPSRYGTFRGAARAILASNKLLVEGHGRHSGAHHQSMPVLR